MKTVNFSIQVEMGERWVDTFCSMLHYMESCGNIGHSALIGFFADGDGDFHPKFTIDRSYNECDGLQIKDRHEEISSTNIPEVIYDADIAR